jgi:hypothetical protein
VREIVAIWYRGSNYQIGRGRDFYGIWPAAESVSQPLEKWPLTREGWYGAWSRFTAVEAPDTIVQAGPPRGTPPGTGTTAPSGPAATSSAPPATSSGPATPTPSGPPTATSSGPATPMPSGPPASAPSGPPAAAASGLPAVTPSGPATSTPPGPHEVAPSGPHIFMPSGPTAAGPADPGSEVPIALPASVPGGERRTLAADASRPAVIAAVLLAVGVACGVIGLFPDYTFGSGLVQQADQLVTHVIYLAGWTASAVLILLGGNRARMGALLGLGLSVVTFGFFFADLGQVIAGGTQVMGAGLVLGLVGWLFCAAGSLAAFLLLRSGVPGWSRDTRVDWVLALTLAGLGAAIAFAPSWDSYTLRTAVGVSQTVTAGYAFSNPGAVIAGDVFVMIGLVAVVVAAALWRPVRYGAALLAGAIIPMAAQAISAVVQLGEGISPAQFGISPGQAAAAGLTISSGVTPAFWIYCAFVAALAVLCGLMLQSRAGRPDAIPPGPVTLDATQPPTSAFR